VKTVRDALRDLEGKPPDYLPTTSSPATAPAFVKRLHATAPGENVYEGYTDGWWRLLPDKPARTVKENHGGVFVHYSEESRPHAKGTRAAAGLPDDYVFEGRRAWS